MKKIIIIAIVLIYNCSAKSQNITLKSEKNILVNSLNILENYNPSTILMKVGNPTKIVDGGQEQIEEFGYQTYEYYYEKSYIMYRDNYISDIFILDTNLSINGIKIGNSINLVKNEFPKFNQMPDCLKIYYEDFTLVFHYKNDIITEITYYTPM